MSLRAAMVGLGGVAWGYPPANRAGRATTHLEAYRVRGLDCVAGCDPDAAAAAKFNAATGVRAYAGLAEMLREARPDVVSICSPDALHFEHARAALEAGVRRLWLEKPPAETAAATRELAALAARHGATVAVNFFRRYHPVFARLREAVQGGEFGRARRVRLQYLTGDALAFTVDAARSGGDARHAEALLSSGELLVAVGGAPLDFHVQETEVLCERARLRATQGGAALWIERAEPNLDYPGFSRLGSAAAPALDEGNPGDRLADALADLLAAHEASAAPRSSLATAQRAMQLYEDIQQRAHGAARRGG
jgi:hypothetical protein